jgi:RNA polymerase sigma-70 factor (ECF subfamily)
VAEATVDFDDFFRLHYARIVRVVHGVTGDRARAEEVAQEAFVRVFQRWSRVSSYDRPDAWVRRVAVRLAVREARRDRLRTTLERRAPAARTPAVGGPLAEEPPAAFDHVRVLPRNQRVAIVLHYLDDLPVADVAAAMGCSEPTVRVHLHRGRRRLAELMSPEVNVDG